MIFARVWRGAPFVLGLVMACGSDDAAPVTETPGAKNPPAPSSTVPPGTTLGPDAGPNLPADPLVGLWDVSGKDERGAYEGQAEVRPAEGGSGYRFIRTVRYPGVTVEGGRELHWLFRGTLTKAGGQDVKLAASLKRLDFITERGAMKRSAGDGPVAISGTFTLSSDSELTGTITGAFGSGNGSGSLADTWRARKPLPAAPLFVDERKVVPAHDPPSATTKSTNFALYSNYHTLDVLKPYVSRPEFQAAVHGHVIDPTDLTFYRANKNALRVVDKVIDDISLAETLARADAYRFTLKEKAEQYDKDAENRFVDPQVGMIPSGGPVGAGYAGQVESGDGALWTGVYLASQVFRHRVTGEQKAKDNVALTLDALLKLQEITGDWTSFARTLRKAGATPPAPPWHAGTGPYANVEWLEGGNNDMIKGLFYGYLLGWEMFCEGGKTGYESLCARIRTNAKHLADDVKLGGSNAPNSQLSNELPSHWLYAIVTESVGDKISYNAKAEAYWSVGKVALKQSPVIYSQGIVDWSGQHLTSIGDLIGIFSAKHLKLGGDADKAYREHVDDSQKNLEKQRFPNWHLMAAIFGSNASASSPFIKDAIARMNEAQVPKVAHTIDRRLTSDFCMSPYPSLPWKGDWMNYPASDRTQGINSHPLFEGAQDVMYWKVGNGYRSGEGVESPGGDFLHLYWMARYYKVISATE